jgi:hypothetical protein
MGKAIEDFAYTSRALDEVYRSIGEDRVIYGSD